LQEPSGGDGGNNEDKPGDGHANLVKEQHAELLADMPADQQMVCK